MDKSRTAVTTDTALATSTLVGRDAAAYHKKDTYGVADLIVHAARKSGRSALSIGMEMMKFAHGKAKLQNLEYVQYGLYDRERFTDAERAEFISGLRHGHVARECNVPGWWIVAGDKWVSSIFVGATGVAMPDIVAVIDKGPRSYDGTAKISTPEALRDFLSGQDFPLFCKLNDGKWSVGASTITGADADHIHRKGRAPISYADFFADQIGDDAFLLQKFVTNHSFLADYTPTTATVRMVNMWTKDGLWTPHAILKLPSAQNDADNFWRSGNLVCQLDVATGEILTVVGKDGPDLVRHETHPETGKAILGRRLPHWEGLCWT